MFDKGFEDEDFGDSGKKSIFEKEKPPTSQWSKSQQPTTTKKKKKDDDDLDDILS